MMARRLRVLHVAPFLWSGAGRVITALCESQAAACDVAIVTSGASGGAHDWRPYRRRLAGAGVGHWRIDLFDRQPAVFWRSVAALHDVVRAWRPDVIHAHAGTPTCAAALCRPGGQPFALVSQVYSWGLGRPPWMDAMDLVGHGLADRVICSAVAYEERLRAAGIPRRRLVRLDWGIPPMEGAHPGASQRVGRRVGCVGRIEPRKAQLDLVRAFACVRRTVPDATLEVVGPVADPAYWERVRADVVRLGLDSAVTFTGYVRNVAARVAPWTLFVSLSRDEGQGLAVLEAMSMGIPVAARVVAGVEDYLQPDVNGIALGGSVANIGRQIAEALRRGDLPDMARRGQALVARRYGWSRTVRRMDAVYASALCARRRV